MPHKQLGDDLLDQMPIGVFRLDPKLQRIHINHRLARFTGWPVGDNAVADLARRPGGAAELKRWTEAIAGVLADGEERSLEFAFERPEGARRIVARLAPQRDETGAIVAVLGVAQDISEWRAAEAALAQSEERFRAFMDQMPVIAWIKDGDGHYLYASQACAHFLGAPDGAWRGRTDFDFVPQGFARDCREADLEVLRSGVARRAAGSAIDAQGNAAEWLMSRFPVQHGSERYIAGVATDITEQRRLMSALSESQERIKGLMDSSPVLVWMKDHDGRYVYMSRSFEERFAYRNGEWHGKNDAELWPEEVARPFIENDATIRREGRAHELIETAPDPDGSLRHWWVLKFPFQNAAGQQFIGGVGIDMTERKRAEDDARLQSQTDELTGLYNRRGFFALAERQHQLVLLERKACALLFVDIDGLKTINDRYGHEMGDQAIVMTGEVLRVSVRDSDIVARIGGDEFVVLAMECSDLVALRERILQRIEDYNRRESLPFRLSASIGISEFTTDPGVSFEQRLTEADARMYKAKRGQR
ncbi:MAG TPA: PAS domain-containing protein [Candidatus Binatia bacterium]|nr:PAS domain-containing protein [Candidatus Binatia bacterium]